MMEAASTFEMYDLELSRRQCIIKSSRATSRVKWLKYENTDVSRAITALVLRVLKSTLDATGSPGRFYYTFEMSVFYQTTQHYNPETAI
jgi:hypothetical protein